MALRERRLIQQYTDTLLPQVQADLKQACGGDIEVTVEWDGFESDMAALERLPSQCFDRLVTAIGWVCKEGDRKSGHAGESASSGSTERGHGGGAEPGVVRRDTNGGGGVGIDGVGWLVPPN